MLFLELIHLHAMFFVETFKVIEELLGFLNVVQGNIAPHSASSLAGISYRLVKSPSGRRQTSKTRQLRRFFFCHYPRLFPLFFCTRNCLDYWALFISDHGNADLSKVTTPSSLRRETSSSSTVGPLRLTTSNLISFVD